MPREKRKATRQEWTRILLLMALGYGIIAVGLTQYLVTRHRHGHTSGWEIGLFAIPPIVIVIVGIRFLLVWRRRRSASRPPNPDL